MINFMRRWWQFFQTVLGVIFRHPVTGTSIIGRLADGRIVLVRRRDNGLWGLPGGLVDWGEDIPTTVKREMQEETGLEVVKIQRLVGVYSAPDRDPRMHSICVVIEADVAGTAEIKDDLEITDVQAFEPATILQQQLAHDHHRQLQDYLNGKTTLA